MSEDYYSPSSGVKARRAVITQVSEDTGPFRLVTVESDGTPYDAQITFPYGVEGNPIKGSNVFLIPIEGEPGQFVGLPEPPPKDRVDGLKEGEVNLQNYKTGNSIKMDKDGTITITATKIVLVGDVELGAAGATRELALKNTTDDAGHKNVGDLSTKVKAV